VRRWIQRLRGGAPSSSATQPRAPTLELVALEGADAGGQFTVDGDEVAVGRGAAQTGRIGAICLRDPSVSPRQAVIRSTPSGVEIEHRAGAAFPTLVNGRAVERSPLAPGDRLQMGAVVFEVRSRGGMTLSGLVRIPEQLAATRAAPAADGPIATTTEVRGLGRPVAFLTLVGGLTGWEGRRFPVVAGRNRIGRSPDCDVLIPEQGVSRHHAELLWERGELSLLHRSTTNPTFVDDEPVAERRVLVGGERIRLADRVVLEVELEESRERPRDASLRARMEEKIQRDLEIEAEFGFSGSFLDIDIVDSHGLKVRAGRPEHIVVSFERFRNFARGVVEEFHGQVLNSNGDELMCFFDEPLQSVRAATALLERLEAFNRKENLLGSPFRVRQGIHTGESLLDRVRGVAYSPVLDTAGHLQKYAPEDGLLVSRATLDALPPGLPFVEVGPVGKEGVQSYRLNGPLD
jgi:pSer/pThr/pTyr-binding forkhead associated (FHA) protein